MKVDGNGCGLCSTRCFTDYTANTLLNIALRHIDTDNNSSINYLSRPQRKFLGSNECLIPLINGILTLYSFQTFKSLLKYEVHI